MYLCSWSFNTPRLLFHFYLVCNFRGTDTLSTKIACKSPHIKHIIKIWCHPQALFQAFPFQHAKLKSWKQPPMLHAPTVKSFSDFDDQNSNGKKNWPPRLKPGFSCTWREAFTMRRLCSEPGKWSSKSRFPWYLLIEGVHNSTLYEI